MIQIFSFTTPEYKSETYLLKHTESNRSIIIDPTNFSIEEIYKHNNNSNFSIDYVIPTHGHFDHIQGVERLSELFEFDIIASKECSIAMSDPKKNYSFYYQNKNNCISLSLPTIIFDEEIYRFQWIDTEIQIIKTPGHSPCSVCISLNNSIVFTGDTIMLEYSPFSKFPDGNSALLKESIKRIYSAFPSSTLIYPGHGDSFSLESIRSHFAFLSQESET